MTTKLRLRMPNAIAVVGRLAISQPVVGSTPTLGSNAFWPSKILHMLSGALKEAGVRSGVGIEKMLWLMDWMLPSQPASEAMFKVAFVIPDLRWLLRHSGYSSL